MSGQLNRGITISASESRNTLGNKLSQLVDLATFSGFDNTNSDQTSSIVYRQSTNPGTTRDGNFWVNTTGNALQVHYGATSQRRWDGFGRGISLLNSTGTTFTNGMVVGFHTGTTVSPLTYNGDAGNVVIGVVGEIVGNGSFGFIKMCGISMVNVKGNVNRCAYLIKGASGSFFALATSTTTTSQTLSFGIALTSCGSNASGSTVMAYLYPARI